MQFLDMFCARSFKMTQHIKAKLDESKFQEAIRMACKLLAIKDSYEERGEAMQAF